MSHGAFGCIRRAKVRSSRARIRQWRYSVCRHAPTIDGATRLNMRLKQMTPAGKLEWAQAAVQFERGRAVVSRSSPLACAIGRTASYARHARLVRHLSGLLPVPGSRPGQRKTAQIVERLTQLQIRRRVDQVATRRCVVIQRALELIRHAASLPAIPCYQVQSRWIRFQCHDAGRCPYRPWLWKAPCFDSCPTPVVAHCPKTFL